MRKLAILLIGLWSACFVGSSVNAQGPVSGVIFFQHRQFKIPFSNDQNPAIKELRLHVSRDQGRTWTMTATAEPREQHFRFSTPNDGYFWFCVQSRDDKGKLHPEKSDDFRASLKVIVDTLPPMVRVTPLPPRNTEVGVSWTIQDDNLDATLPDAVRVEYRILGAANWIPLSVPPGANQIYWAPGVNGQVEVRISARDRAGNLGDDKTTVSLAGGASLPFGNPFINDAFKDLNRKFVGSKQVGLSFDLKDVGPSGVSAVELWYTLYKARAWNKLKEFPVDVKNPLDANQPQKIAFEVEEEGIYGITLVAKSGVGLGERAPQPGERPQFWIEVDVTKPIVQIHDIQVHTGLEKGKLTIAWNARDKNFGGQPIRLSFAEDKIGPWNTFADKLANSGKYIWKMPEGLPYQFYLRVEAVDLAGNVGEAVTNDKVKVDLSLPKVQIRDIEPGR
ncbi:MAG: hypothetical protein FJ303_13300 [Planctomycetes bacterium]|nr:hypothetical protein [Planctomycetota bacterium]